MSKQGIYILICAQTKMCFSILKLHKNIFLPPCLLIFIQKDLQWIQRVAHKQGQRYELHVQCFSKILWESWINLLRKKKNQYNKNHKIEKWSPLKMTKFYCWPNHCQDKCRHATSWSITENFLALLLHGSKTFCFNMTWNHWLLAWSTPKYIEERSSWVLSNKHKS